MIELEELYGDRHRYEEHCDHDYPVDHPICCECLSTSDYREYFKVGDDVFCDKCLKDIIVEIMARPGWVSELAEFMGAERVVIHD